MNIEVELGGLSAFRADPSTLQSNRIAYADLQTNPDLNVALRLGAGRSGFYLGRYLKGIGRTLLSANWNYDGADLLHSSGILLANAAIREYLVSAFVEAHGLGNAINPCTGILLRALPAGLKRHAANSFYARHPGRGSRGRQYLSKADRTIQAISVKAGGFARFSNFNWWLCNYPPRLGAAAFFTALYRSLEPWAPVQSGVDADAIVDRLYAALDRAIDNLLCTWSLGIHWGSFHNNATIDGRFLDLENPSIFPRPVVGSLVALESAVEPERSLHAEGDLIGFSDITKTLRHIKAFIDIMRLRMEYLADNHLCEPLEGEFMRALAGALRRKQKHANVLTSQRALERRVVPWIAKRLGADSGDSGTLRQMFREACWRSKLYPGMRRPEGHRLPVLHRVQMPIAMARPEPWVQCALYVPDFLHGYLDVPVDSHALVNEAILVAESMHDPDDLLDYLSDAPRRLKSATRPESTT